MGDEVCARLRAALAPGGATVPWAGVVRVESDCRRRLTTDRSFLDSLAVCLGRHARCDWGSISPHTRRRNEDALRIFRETGTLLEAPDGLYSRYELAGGVVLRIKSGAYTFAEHITTVHLEEGAPAWDSRTMRRRRAS